MSESQNEGEPWEWHIVEAFKGLINLSIEALKALLLINGGAAVAILAYLGSLTSRGAVAHAPNMKNALLCFAGGVLATGLAFIAAYFTQYRLYYEERARHMRQRFRTLHPIGVAIAALLVFTSASAFAIGCWIAAKTFTHNRTMKNPVTVEIGQMAHRLADGYFVHLAAMQIATDPRAVALSPPVQPGQLVPISDVYRKDGTRLTYHFTHFLALARTNPQMAEDLKRLWFVGALLTLGDALADQRYFDRAPELELVRHLRNGVAHGNTFDIRDPSQLANRPAHNGLAWVKSDTKKVFEVTPNLHGKPVLFDFMGPGDVLDLLSSVSIYLINMGYGNPLRPE